MNTDAFISDINYSIGNSGVLDTEDFVKDVNPLKNLMLDEYSPTNLGETDQPAYINHFEISKEILRRQHIQEVRRKFSEDSDYFSDTVNWIGYVEEVHGDSFKARLKELESKGTDEQAEFDMEEVSRDDVNLVEVGAVFYYSIGYASIKGQRVKQEMLKFKRNVTFSENDVDNISNKVKQLEQNICWE